MNFSGLSYITYCNNLTSSYQILWWVMSKAQKIWTPICTTLNRVLDSVFYWKNIQLKECPSSEQLNTSWKIIFYFSKCSEKIVLQDRWYFFLKLCYHPSVEKAKMFFSRKNAFKDNISGIIENNDIYPRKYVISLSRKINGNKKVYFY